MVKANNKPIKSEISRVSEKKNIFGEEKTEISQILRSKTGLLDGQIHALSMRCYISIVLYNITTLKTNLHTQSMTEIL